MALSARRSDCRNIKRQTNNRKKEEARRERLRPRNLNIQFEALTHRHSRAGAPVGARVEKRARIRRRVLAESRRAGGWGEGVRAPPNLFHLRVGNGDSHSQIAPQAAASLARTRKAAEEERHSRAPERQVYTESVALGVKVRLALAPESV